MEGAKGNLIVDVYFLTLLNRAQIGGWSPNASPPHHGPVERNHLLVPGRHFWIYHVPDQFVHPMRASDHYHSTRAPFLWVGGIE